MQGLRDSVTNLILAAVSLLAAYAFAEVIAAKLLLTRTPLNRQEFLSDSLRVLAQSSKDGVAPRPGYIALAGDSYAAGAGDWLLEADPSANGPFHSAHVLHERTGRDVISLGHSAWGSLDGFVSGPRSVLDCINRLALFDVPEPGLMLLYFYEGNDLEDNLRDVRVRFLPTYDNARLRDPAYFRTFIDARTALARTRCGVADNLVFRGFLARRGQGAPSSWEGAAPPVPAIEEGTGESRENLALVAGGPVALPLGLQSPALDLGDQEVDLGLYVLDQSMSAARAAFPRSRMALVYVPSPLSSYTIVSDLVSVQVYEPGAAESYPKALLRERSDSLARRVALVCARNGLPFIDPRPDLRSAAQAGFVHGPRDWKHFNRRGNTVLAEAIARELGRIEGLPPG